MYYALVNPTTQIVENVVVLEDQSTWTPPADMLLVPLQDSFGMGDTWNGSEFIRRQIVLTPEEQARAALDNNAIGEVPDVIG